MAVGSLEPIHHARSREDELAKRKIQSSSKSESREQHKGVHRVGFSQDKAKSRQESKPVEEPKRSDKLDFLMAYRREKGLCFKCGDKWNKQHKCPPQVPLHVIEELLEVIDYTDHSESDSDDISTLAENSLMAVSDDSSSLKKHRRTMQFRGLIGKQEVLILVDSGSEYSFVSEDIVTTLQCSVDTIPTELYTVADGGSVSCTQMIPELQWWTQGYSFARI